MTKPIEPGCLAVIVAPFMVEGRGYVVYVEGLCTTSSDWLVTRAGKRTLVEGDRDVSWWCTGTIITSLGDVYDRFPIYEQCLRRLDSDDGPEESTLFGVPEAPAIPGIKVTHMEES